MRITVSFGPCGGRTKRVDYTLSYANIKAAGTATITLNGKYDTSFNVAALTSNDDLASVAWEAYHTTQERWQYKGWMDELTLYKRALTSSQIKALYSKRL